MKKISLALWWWAARGYIHIWVLKYLEEKNVEIKEIAWTSMWAILWSLIAIWKTSKEIEEIAENLNILKLIDFDFSLWLLKWNKVEAFLKDIFQDKKIEDTKIPLKIVATNIEENKSKIFEKGYIYEAVRASLSLPWVFRPKIIDDKLYVDGGILMNLPIEALNGKNILAVSALKVVSWVIVQNKKILWFSIKTWFWQNNYEIIKRSVVSMMDVNEKRSLQTEWKNITFIRPEFLELDIADFDKVDKFVKIGYDACGDLNF